VSRSAPSPVVFAVPRPSFRRFWIFCRCTARLSRVSGFFFVAQRTGFVFLDFFALHGAVPLRFEIFLCCTDRLRPVLSFLVSARFASFMFLDFFSLHRTPDRRFSIFRRCTVRFRRVFGFFAALGGADVAPAPDPWTLGQVTDRRRRSADAGPEGNVADHRWSCRRRRSRCAARDEGLRVLVASDGRRCVVRSGTRSACDVASGGSAPRSTCEIRAG